LSIPNSRDTFRQLFAIKTDNVLRMHLARVTSVSFRCGSKKYRKMEKRKERENIENRVKGGAASAVSTAKY
jgi:hypothetical protein